MPASGGLSPCCMSRSVALLLSLATVVASPAEGGHIAAFMPHLRTCNPAGLRSPAISRGLGLRGGGVANAETAATEEEEKQAMPSQVPAVEGTADAAGVDGGEGSTEDKLRQHLLAVEANPGNYIAHPKPGSLRFRICDSDTLARKLPGITSASIELPVTRRRNAWQRFYPLDLAQLLPDLLDTEEVFDEEGEMGQARTLAATGGEAAVPVSGAMTSVVSPWAWASQKVTFADGTTGAARLLFAQESVGVIMWSLQRGSEAPMVERVQISDELGATPQGTKVSITWTSVTADALNRLPDSTQPQAADKSDIAAASGADDAAAGEARIKTALKRLQTMMGASDQADLRLKLFAEPSAPTCASEEGGSRTDKVLLLDLTCNTWVERDASELRVGDVVKVLKTQRFPADLLLLHASSPTEVCIETSCFDKDTALRHWQCVPASITSHDLAQAAQGGSGCALLDALGAGDAAVVQQLQAANMSLHVRSSRIAAEWETWEAVLEPSGEEEQKGVHKVTFGYRQLLPWQAKLLVTDWVVGVVLFQGGDTCLALSGGQRGCERQARRLELQKRHEAGVKESAKQKQFADEAARPPVDPEDFEDETKIKWRSSFTDVPDDGNCLMHAVWLGLKTLLQSYPRLKVSEDEVLPATAESFRKESIARMRKDTAYKEAVGNQLMLWVSVECDLLFGLEDFFCLPPEFQTRVIDYNQQVQMAGLDPSQLDMEQLVEEYMSSLTQLHKDGDRVYYLPLGELEIDALCRLFKIRLQVIKTEAIDHIIEGQNKHAPPLEHSDKVAVEDKVLPVLNKIKEEVTPWEAAREAIDTVLLYVNNILDNPQEDKFKVLKRANAVLQRRVLAKAHGEELLLNLGFAEDKNEQGDDILRLKDSLPPHPGPTWFRAARRALQTFLSEQGDLTRVIDPRTIRAEHYLDRNNVDGSRLVRILNVRTNHYQVHLPRP